MPKRDQRDPLERTSLSLPQGLLARFDELIESRGFQSRSQAMAELMARELDRYESLQGNSFMTGTITLVYDHRRTDLKRRLAEIQYSHIAEVISSLHVLLEDQHTMEVVLVQGRSMTLRRIADELITCRGVVSGTMTLSSSLIPPLQYPETDQEGERAAPDTSTSTQLPPSAKDTARSPRPGGLS